MIDPDSDSDSDFDTDTDTDYEADQLDNATDLNQNTDMNSGRFTSKSAAAAKAGGVT